MASVYSYRIVSNLTTLAEMADKMMENTKVRLDPVVHREETAYNVAAIHHQQKSSIETRLDSLEKSVNEIKKKIISNQRNNRHRSRSHSRTDESGIRRVHQKYKEKARYCVPPCNF